MNEAEILRAAVEALAGDAGFVGWCVERFGEPPNILTDVQEFWPEPEDYPAVAVRYLDGVRAESGEVYHILVLGAGISDSNTETVARTVQVRGVPVAVSARIRSGIGTAADFRAEAENALARAKLGTFRVERAYGVSGEGNGFASVSLVTITQILTTRHGLGR